MAVKKPKHEKLHKGNCGRQVSKPRGMIVHCTVSDPRPGPSDRHGVINYLAGKGYSVPMVVDDEAITEMLAYGCMGIHAKGLSDVYGVEQIGQATWSRDVWKSHKKTIHHTAQIAAWLLHEKMGLPVTKANLKKFVVGHDRDHVFGGTSDHWDPGPHYPWKMFYNYAIDYATAEGYRVVARKGDRKKVREFRLPARKRMKAWIMKRVNSGWKVALTRKRFKSDFDGWD